MLDHNAIVDENNVKKSASGSRFIIALIWYFVKADKAHAATRFKVQSMGHATDNRDISSTNMITMSGH